MIERDTINEMVSGFIELSSQIQARQYKYDRTIEEYKNQIADYVAIINNKNERIKQLELNNEA